MSLIPVAEALARVLDGVAPLPAEQIPVGEAHGRVLAKPLAALRTQPPADISAMDGYAVRAADLAKAAKLKLVGESGAGKPFSGKLKAGEAVRIFTGAVMPAGADTVVIQEEAKREGDQIALPATAAEKNVRKRGLDFSEGQVLLAAGRRLSARDLGLAAAMDHAKVAVARRPRIAYIATGDELTLPGMSQDPHRIVASNPIALAALLRPEGADSIDLGIVPDKLEATIEAIRRARTMNIDVLVTLGGASVGDHDLIAPALKAEGIALAFHRVALRPGRPLLLGIAGNLRVLGLPGNPVSAFVCAFLFLVPLLRALQGRGDAIPKPEPAVLGRAMAENDHRQDYLRAKIERIDGRLVATPCDRQDSSMLAMLVSADGLLLRAPHALAAKAGSPCEVLRFGD